MAHIPYVGYDDAQGLLGELYRVNRLADGLGVELEEHWNEKDLTMTPDEFRSRTGHLPPRATS